MYAVLFLSGLPIVLLAAARPGRKRVPDPRPAAQPACAFANLKTEIAMDIILLERIARLGQMGDVVRVKRRLCPQLPSAARQGAPRQRGQQEALRIGAVAPRSPQP